jgi:anti-sigma28 factor (negative regulator of flagellin synthesis)
MSYGSAIGSGNSISSGQDSVAPANAGRVARAGTGSSDPTGQTNASGNAATTTLSTTAGLLAVALSGSDVRLDRVTTLQQAIGAGTYNIPASDVAAKVLGALLS